MFPKRIILIADAFPPLKNSAAVLIASLAEALAKHGCKLVVVTPSHGIDKSYVEEIYDEFIVLRINCGKIKSRIKLFRGLNELLLFFLLPYRFKKTHYSTASWDGVIWYSPSIFLSGIVRFLKSKSKANYLILRDIVPGWMVDVGIMKRGPSFFLLKWFELYQYRLADTIGVQSSGNLSYFSMLNLPKLKRLEVLSNWMPSTQLSSGNVNNIKNFISLEKTILAGRKILIYAGNLGEAQGVVNFINLLLSMKDNLDIGFLIVGRGSKKEWLEKTILSHKLVNVLLLDEVDLCTLADLYRQCDAGLIFLDYGHKSHNIPGKFISYLEAGLPSIALVNPGNDLINIINSEGLGFATGTFRDLSSKVANFAAESDAFIKCKTLARAYYEKNYQPNLIASQVLEALEG